MSQIDTIIRSSLFSLFLVAFIQGCSVAIAQDLAREGYFYQPVERNDSGLTEEQYHEVRLYFIFSFQQAVSEKTGKVFFIPDNWNSPYFAGFAEQKESMSSVSIWGGTVRASGMNRAQMAAVLCHEIGHHIGGSPLQKIPGVEWSSIEGVADYYAAKECLPRVIADRPQWFPQEQKNFWQACGEHATCRQVADVGLKLVQFFQRYSYREYTPVSLEASAPPSSHLLDYTYPSDQCRLDTFKQGALCLASPKACHFPACWAGAL